MAFSFTEFVEIEFPRHKEIVYDFCYTHPDTSLDIPLYVGETSRGVGRFGDYLSAKFSAPTDFKVGEAVRFLPGCGFAVKIRYKESPDRKVEERAVIEELQKETRLLNELKGFNHTTAHEDVERGRLHEFLKILVEEKGVRRERKRTVSPIANDRTDNLNPRKSAIPGTIHAICKELGKDGQVISRRAILAQTSKLGIKDSSVLPADYCDNTAIGKWSRYSFLHSVGPGRYILRKPEDTTT